MFYASEKKHRIKTVGRKEAELVKDSLNTQKCTVKNKQPKAELNSYFLKATALREENAFKEAAANYLNAILIDRNDADSYYGLGVCYKHLENYPKAIKYLDKASELKEDFYEAFFELGVCHLLEGIPCGAIKNFIRAIQIKPDNPDAILQLGISHEICEEHDLALMIYQKLIENSPKFIKAYDHKSSLLMKLDRYKEACTILNEIIKINPDYYRAYVGIGICFDKLGKRADAQRYYRKFLERKPFSHQAQFVKTRLNKIKNIRNTNNTLKIV